MSNVADEKQGSEDKQPEEKQPEEKQDFKDERLALPTRISASWTAVVVGALVLVLLIIFIAENTQNSSVNFLGLHGTAPTSVVLLIAAAAGALIVVTVAVARILQLRRAASSHPES
jgi:uncharacterized integral membrane protein